MMRIEGSLRNLALSTLGIAAHLSGVSRVAAAASRVQFLYLHDPYGLGEDRLPSMLRALAESYRFVSYTEAVERVRTGDIDAAYLSLSFDDGLKGCLRASATLHELGIPACFFVCPTVVGETDPKAIGEFCRERLHVPPADFMSWDDLETLRIHGHEIGSHSMSHPNLARVNGEELTYEIGSSFEVLSKRLGEVRHFAWPFGGFEHFTPQAAKLVFQAGFQSCASAVRGCHASGGERHPWDLCIRRDHILPTWPRSHVRYFLTRNSLRRSERSNAWPRGWQSTIGHATQDARSHPHG